MATATEVLTRKPKNIAIETNAQHELNVVDVETLEPGSDDCLVHVRATGICGSDVRTSLSNKYLISLTLIKVHFWKHGNIGDSTITQPCGLGHESAGIVVKTGSNVQRLKIGSSHHSLP